MICKEICKQYKAKKMRGMGGPYAQGHKHCRTCEIFISFNGAWCPCCNYKLRSKPRRCVYKNNLKMDQERDQKRI